MRYSLDRLKEREKPTQRAKYFVEHGLGEFKKKPKSE